MSNPRHAVRDARRHEAALRGRRVCPDTVPAHVRINRFVSYGYKDYEMTTAECAASVFQFNNETVNVWTSLLIVAYAALCTAVALASTQREPLFRSLLAISCACRGGAAGCSARWRTPVAPTVRCMS